MLHRYDWSESSLILEVFSRHHGRIALVAKGAKRPSSSFRPVLLPLQPLRVAFGGDAEIRTLKGAEWVGGQVMPTGDALLSGYYLNELLLRPERSTGKRILKELAPYRKRIGRETRQELEKLLGAKVFIELWVKVRSGWADDEARVRSFGYE